jgi:hypothetical protein
VAYAFCAKWALREEGRRPADLERWLTPRELAALVRGGTAVGMMGGVDGREGGWVYYKLASRNNQSIPT